MRRLKRLWRRYVSRIFTGRPWPRFWVQSWARSLSVAAVGIFCLGAAAIAHASGGAAPTAADLHINWWTWDDHAPPVGWFFVDFVLFLAVLVRFGGKPVENGLAGRKITIGKDIEAAQARLEAAQAADAALTKALSGSDAQVAHLEAEAQKRGDAEYTQIIAEAKAATERLRSEAVARRLGEQSRLQRQLEQQLVAKALSHAHTKLETALDGPEHTARMNAALADLQGLCASEQCSALMGGQP